MPTGRRQADRPGEKVPVKEQVANGYGGAATAIMLIGAGVVSPAALITVLLFLAHVSSQQDRNCQNIKTIGEKSNAIIKVDGELNQPRNRDLRRALLNGGVSCK